MEYPRELCSFAGPYAEAIMPKNYLPEECDKKIPPVKTLKIDNNLRPIKKPITRTKKTMTISNPACPRKAAPGWDHSKMNDDKVVTISKYGSFQDGPLENGRRPKIRHDHSRWRPQ